MNSEVFGGDGSFSWSWFLPTTPVYLHYEQIVGYNRSFNGERWKGYEENYHYMFKTNKISKLILKKAWEDYTLEPS